MTSEQRLAEAVRSLEEVGLNCLVMGGHAVRFYGLLRHTDDFDVCLSPDQWVELPQRLSASRLFGGAMPQEGPTWRKHAFRRFVLDQLPDGRELWLEFWGQNHLLDAFGHLWDRSESGEYGGQQLRFLSLPDLIRSKETERLKDWQDVVILSEFLDARHLTNVKVGMLPIAVALSNLRSRRGLESFYLEGFLSDQQAVKTAIQSAKSIVTVSLLLPFAPDATADHLPLEIERPIAQKLRTISPLSGVHLALVEAVRRQYERFAMALDRADKQSLRAAEGDVAQDEKTQFGD